MSKTHDSFKLFLNGDIGTGKSFVLSRFCGKHYNALPTIGCNFESKTIYLDRKTIKLLIWDATGHERFKSIRAPHYKNTKGIMLFYDITNKDTFDNIKHWIKEIEKVIADVEMILVGNKCELEDQRQVSKEMGEQLASECGIKFIEISAKGNIGVEEAFHTLARSIKIKMEKKLEENKLPKIQSADPESQCTLL